jgi:glycosyltransferase involved in cell wall biosynthesis
MKTIGIVINTSWHIYNFRTGLIKALKNTGYHVVAIAPKDIYSQKLVDTDIEYFEIKMNNMGTNLFEDINLVYDYYKLFKKLKLDIVLLYTIKPNIYGSIAAKMLHIPVISSITGLGTVFLHDKVSSKIAKLLYKLTLRIPQKVFFENPYDKNVFLEQGFIKNKEQIVLIPGAGINTNKYIPISKIEFDESNQTKFLFIARLVKDKGLIEYIEAIRLVLSQYPHAEFAILGPYYPGNPTAITEKEMDEWVKEGIVTYMGESDDVRTIIAEYDCIVLPSYREGLSRVLLEAASMAKPIITTNVPGCKDVVEDGINGFLCEKQNIEDLAARMEQVIRLSKEELLQMGKSGRAKVIKEFDEPLVNSKYINAIQEILAVR